MTDDKIDASLEADEDDVIDEEEDSAGFDPKSLILFIIIPLLLVGGGAAAYFTGMLDSMLGTPPAEEQMMTEDGTVPRSASAGTDEPVFFEMEPMTVNLNSDQPGSQFLRLTVFLELTSEEDRPLIEAVMPRVKDQFQTYMRELRVRDLRGTAGLLRLRAELLTRVNAAVAPIEVRDVLFDEMLIQ